jgi:hypothetical protein
LTLAPEERSHRVRVVIQESSASILAHINLDMIDLNKKYKQVISRQNTYISHVWYILAKQDIRYIRMYMRNKSGTRVHDKNCVFFEVFGWVHRCTPRYIHWICVPMIRHALRGIYNLVVFKTIFQSSTMTFYIRKSHFTIW